MWWSYGRTSSIYLLSQLKNVRVNYPKKILTRRGTHRSNNDVDKDFPGIDDQAFCLPPRPTDPQTCTLSRPNGREVKWCSEYEMQGRHIRTQCHVGSNGDDAGDSVAKNEEISNANSLVIMGMAMDDSAEPGGAFT